MLKRLVAAGCLLAVAVLSAATTGLGSTPQDESAKLKVAFVTNNDSAYWSFAEAGATKAAEEAGVNLLFRRPAVADPSTQQEVIDRVLKQGARAVTVVPFDPKNQSEYYARIADKIPLLTGDTDAPDCHRLCYIGADDYEAGRAAGRLVKEAIPDGGTVAIFVGALQGDNALQRRQGIIDELAVKSDSKIEDGVTYGNYKLHRTFTDIPEGPPKTRSLALRALQDLAGERNVCMVGLWSYEPPIILSAVKDKGKVGKIKIVAFDEDPETLDGIAEGDIVGTVVQNSFQVGYKSVKMMAALAKGDKSKIPADGLLHVDFRVVTKEGGKEYREAVHGEKKSIAVKEFRTGLKKLLGKE